MEFRVLLEKIEWDWSWYVKILVEKQSLALNFKESLALTQNFQSRGFMFEKS